MRQELDDLLCSRYPGIFRDRHGTAQTTAMCWGFTCGDGWFDLLDVLCAEIERHARETGLDAVAVQVKEKFGSLRVHIHGGDDYIRGLIGMAGSLSQSVCEECGLPGVTPSKERMKALCSLHAETAPDQEPTEAPPRFGGDADFSRLLRLPPIRTERWQHIALALEKTLSQAIRYSCMPMILIDEAIETESLSFRWHGGDDKGHAKAFFRLVEAYSIRV
ncbi:hypothetical protein AzCIB_0402 [Azoarcus sp. CIB]|uniref:hypothetical protein n=1 Tax=Aromatoleum sp. (strain CIB) TaxID=198107 RepID=UPI00067E3E83|nr:hypothetical protein [Azoarcus sp. CIB]AKU10307.1 hypothetical protein AzCIB_0402 [Azoarcus sp. CIB]